MYVSMYVCVIPVLWYYNNKFRSIMLVPGLPNLFVFFFFFLRGKS